MVRPTGGWRSGSIPERFWRTGVPSNIHFTYVSIPAPNYIPCDDFSLRTRHRLAGGCNGATRQIGRSIRARLGPFPASRTFGDLNGYWTPTRDRAISHRAQPTLSLTTFSTPTSTRLVDTSWYPARTRAASHGAVIEDTVDTGYTRQRLSLIRSVL